MSRRIPRIYAPEDLWVIIPQNTVPNMEAVRIWDDAKAACDEAHRRNHDPRKKSKRRYTVVTLARALSDWEREMAGEFEAVY